MRGQSDDELTGANLASAGPPPRLSKPRKARSHCAVSSLLRIRRWTDSVVLRARDISAAVGGNRNGNHCIVELAVGFRDDIDTAQFRGRCRVPVWKAGDIFRAHRCVGGGSDLRVVLGPEPGAGGEEGAGSA